MRPYVLNSQNLAPVWASPSVLHETACQHLESQFALKGCSPFLWLVGHRSDVLWIETPWESDAEKSVAVAMMRVMVSHPEVQAYSHMVEAWAGHFDVNLSEKDRQYWTEFSEKHGVRNLPPSMRDDVAMVMTFGRDGTSLCSRYLVTDRRGQGKGPNFIGPRQDEHGMQWAGPMANLFADPRKLDEEIEKAVREAGANQRKDRKHASNSDQS